MSSKLNKNKKLFGNFFQINVFDKANMERCNFSHVKYAIIKKIDFSFDFNQSVYFRKKYCLPYFLKVSMKQNFKNFIFDSKKRNKYIDIFKMNNF
jgi:hypothetical protein